MIAFIHVPKTAGTSMRRVFEERYGVDKCFWTDKWEDGERMLENPEDFSGYEVVGGHLPLSYFRMLPILKYVSILRSPIQRYASHYIHMKRTTEHPLHELAKSLSIGDFLKEDRRKNEQCWYFDEMNPTYKNVVRSIVRPPTMVLGVTEALDDFVVLLRKYVDRELAPNGFPRENAVVMSMMLTTREADALAFELDEDFQLYKTVLAATRAQLNELP